MRNLKFKFPIFLFPSYYSADSNAVPQEVHLPFPMARGSVLGLCPPPLSPPMVCDQSWERCGGHRGWLLHSRLGYFKYSTLWLSSSLSISLIDYSCLTSVLIHPFYPTVLFENSHCRFNYIQYQVYSCGNRWKLDTLSIIFLWNNLGYNELNSLLVTIFSTLQYP